MERVGPVGGPEVHADTLALPRSRGKELGEAHKYLHITSDEFDEVGAEIASALDHFNVPEREKEEVLAAIVARKDEVVSSP
jgi:hemoglobin